MVWGDAGSEGGSGASGTVVVDGSSTVEPMSKAASELLSEENPDVRVQYRAAFPEIIVRVVVEGDDATKCEQRANEVAARARKDIGRALALSSDDASVQLEAGNIAAVEGNEAAARSAWETAMRVAPGSAQAQSASDALAGLGGVQAR